MNKVKVIDCNFSDLDELQSLSLSTFSETYRHLNDPIQFDLYLQKAFSKEQLSTELKNTDSFFYFIQIDSKNVGYLKLNIGKAQSESREDHYLEIERIYLQQEYQGLGFGVKLLHKALEIAKMKSKATIWLGVWEKNPDAIKFYEKMGYRKSGTHTFVIGEERQTDFVMEKKLN